LIAFGLEIRNQFKWVHVFILQQKSKEGKGGVESRVRSVEVGVLEKEAAQIILLCRDAEIEDPESSSGPGSV